MIDPFQPGFVAFYLILAGVLTLFAGLVSLALYRRSVERWMRHGSGTAARPASDETPPPRAVASTAAPLRTEVVDLSRAVAARHPRSPTFRAARAALTRAAAVYALAGLAHAAVGTLLHLGFGTFGFAPIRAFVWFWAASWPVVLTLALLWGPDRVRQLTAVGGYLGVLVLVALYVELATQTTPLEMGRDTLLAGVTLPAFFQPVLLWALLAAPTVFLVLFLNRRVRAIGPLLFVFAFVSVAGAAVALLVIGTAPGGTLLLVLAVATGTSVEGWFYGAQLLGMAVFAVPGWLAASLIRRRYQRKRLSDQSLVFDAIWLLATLMVCQGLVQEVGSWGWSGLLAFVGYKLVTRLGLAPLARRAGEGPSARLLLLRVFGFRKRTERFFALLSARWRYAGSIQLIAAPDLAAATIEASEFLEFLSGRLRRAFVFADPDLDRRLTEVDLRPDPDGRFRVNEFFCAGDVWQALVTRLMTSSEVVAMDLRGFSPANRGCLFEIRALLASIPVGRIVLVIDATTDRPFLEATLTDEWRGLDPASPNARVPHPTIRLLPSHAGDRTAVKALMALGDEALVAATPTRATT